MEIDLYDCHIHASATHFGLIGASHFLTYLATTWDDNGQQHAYEWTTASWLCLNQFTTTISSPNNNNNNYKNEGYFQPQLGPAPR